MINASGCPLQYKECQTSNCALDNMGIDVAIRYSIHTYTKESDILMTMPYK